MNFKNFLVFIILTVCSKALLAMEIKRNEVTDKEKCITSLLLENSSQGESKKNGMDFDKVVDYSLKMGAIKLLLHDEESALSKQNATDVLNFLHHSQINDSQEDKSSKEEVISQGCQPAQTLNDLSQAAKKQENSCETSNNLGNSCVKTVMNPAGLENPQSSRLKEITNSPEMWKAMKDPAMAQAQVDHFIGDNEETVSINSQKNKEEIKKTDTKKQDLAQEIPIAVKFHKIDSYANPKSLPTIATIDDMDKLASLTSHINLFYLIRNNFNLNECSLIQLKTVDQGDVSAATSVGAEFKSNLCSGFALFNAIQIAKQAKCGLDQYQENLMEMENQSLAWKFVFENRCEPNRNADEVKSMIERIIPKYNLNKDDFTVIENAKLFCNDLDVLKTAIDRSILEKVQDGIKNKANFFHAFILNDTDLSVDKNHRTKAGAYPIEHWIVFAVVKSQGKLYFYVSDTIPNNYHLQPDSYEFGRLRYLINLILDIHQKKPKHIEQATIDKTAQTKSDQEAGSQSDGSANLKEAQQLVILTDTYELLDDEKISTPKNNVVADVKSDKEIVLEDAQENKSDKKELLNINSSEIENKKLKNKEVSNLVNELTNKMNRSFRHFITAGGFASAGLSTLLIDAIHAVWSNRAVSVLQEKTFSLVYQGTKQILQPITRSAGGLSLRGSQIVVGQALRDVPYQQIIFKDTYNNIILGAIIVPAAYAIYKFFRLMDHGTERHELIKKLNQ